MVGDGLSMTGPYAGLMFFHHIEHLLDARADIDLIGAAPGRLAGGGGVGIMPCGDAFDDDVTGTDHRVLLKSLRVQVI